MQAIRGLGFAQMLRDVFVASINKGQFLLALIGLSPHCHSEDAADGCGRVVFRIVDLLESGRILGFVAAVLWRWVGSACALAAATDCASCVGSKSLEDGAPEAEFSEGTLDRAEAIHELSDRRTGWHRHPSFALRIDHRTGSSVRMKLRFELFSLRDDLRLLRQAEIPRSATGAVRMPAGISQCTDCGSASI